MTAEQQAAYVNAQTACALIEMHAMEAQNRQDASVGRNPTYVQSDFLGLIEKYGLHHNAVVGTFT